MLSIFQFNIKVLAQKDTMSDDGSSTLSIGTGYSTNTNVFGNVSSYTNQPSYSGSFSYSGKKGLNLSFSPTFVGNSDSTNSKFTSEYDFVTSYKLTLWKALGVTPSFTHYLYSSNSASLKSGYNNYAQLSSSLSIKWWSASVSGGYGWGQTSDFSIGLATSATIKFENFLGKDNSLEIQPSLGSSLSRNKLNNLYNSKKTKGLDELIKLYPNMTANEFLTSTDPAIVAWRNAHPAVVSSISKKVNKIQTNGGKKQKTNLLLSDLLAPKMKFGLTSVNISLPITYNIKNFSLSTNFEYTIPNSKTDPASFYVNFGVSYSFDL